MTKLFVTAEMLQDTDELHPYARDLLQRFPGGAHWSEILVWIASRGATLNAWTPDHWTWMMGHRWAQPVRNEYEVFRTIRAIAKQQHKTACARAASYHDTVRKVLLADPSLHPEATERSARNYFEQASRLEHYVEGLKAEAERYYDELLSTALLYFADKLAEQAEG